ncbi:hypothetical protein DYB31_012317, partial [Aphanomyces astaci]
MYKLDWSERIGLESFADQFQELTRKMTAAERSHVTRFLCLLPPRFLCLLPPRFANSASYITCESRDTTKFATMRSVLEELKLDGERQQLSNPSLGKNADRSDDALNETVNGECHYRHRPGNFRSECRRRQSDEAKGLSQYATDETDECNAAMSTYKREAIIDSGATAHMTGDIDLLHSVVVCTRGVRLADGHPIPVTAMGDLKIKSEETGRTATFKNVLYVPTLKKTLVSISRINRQSGDASLIFKKYHCQLRNKNKLSITARWNDSYLYAIQGKFIFPGMDDEANAAEAADTMLWHAHRDNYVDDVLVCTSNDDEITDVFEHLQRRIRLNDLGPISKLFGIEIDRHEKSKSMYVTQRTYIERMAIKYGMDKSKRVDTPIPADTSMVDNAGLPLDDDKPFRQIAGSLLYCAMSTRPDIVDAVAQLSRHLSTPHQLHMFMAKRTVAYLLHTKEVGI